MRPLTGAVLCMALFGVVTVTLLAVGQTILGGAVFAIGVVVVMLLGLTKLLESSDRGDPRGY